MSTELPTPIDGVLDVELVRGADAEPGARPDLLVEVPHGADRRAHYDALRERLVGDLPADLHVFFHVNTDVGAWDYGRATAEAIVAADPTRTALLLRCLVPRTFVDCNRPADFTGENLSEGGLTAGIPAYVRDDRDRALLLDLHAQYVRAAESAYEATCGDGGAALVPHTYGPRTIGIGGVGEDIVAQLRWAYEPERVSTWPLRAEVDLLTRDLEGVELAPAGVEAALLRDFAEAGFQVEANETYCLQPPALGHAWSSRWPGRVTSLEVRRDLLVEEWRPFEEMIAVPDRVERVSGVLAPVLQGVS